MAGLSDDAESKILNVIFGKATYTSPAIWVALARAVISDTDTGSTISEPSGGNYTRAYVSAAGWVSATATSSGLDNSAAIVFASCTASWGTITHFALCDSSTGGNLIAFSSVQTAKAVVSDDIVQFGTGTLDILLS